MFHLIATNLTMSTKYNPLHPSPNTACKTHPYISSDRIQSGDYVCSMLVVLREQTEGHSSHGVVAPALVQSLEQGPGQLKGKGREEGRETGRKRRNASMENTKA